MSRKISKNETGVSKDIKRGASNTDQVASHAYGSVENDLGTNKM